MYPRISVLGEKLSFSSVTNGTYLSQIASTWRRWHLLVGWASSICGSGDFQKSIHNSPAAVARKKELRHEHMRTRANMQQQGAGP